MKPIPEHDGVTVLSTQTVWSGHFPLQVVRFQNRRFDGTMSEPRSWELWRRGNAAALLPYDPWTDEVVTVEQFRLPVLAAGLDPLMVELPAGLADAGEAPEQVVSRESQEETGIRPDRLERIGGFMLTPGGCDEHCTLFAARVRAPAADADGLAGYAGLREEQEDLRIRVLPADVAIERALAGAYPNVITTVGLLWLAVRREWLRARWA